MNITNYFTQFAVQSVIPAAISACQKDATVFKFFLLSKSIHDLSYAIETASQRAFSSLPQEAHWVAGRVLSASIVRFACEQTGIPFSEEIYLLIGFEAFARLSNGVEKASKRAFANLPEACHAAIGTALTASAIWVAFDQMGAPSKIFWSLLGLQIFSKLSNEVEKVSKRAFSDLPEEGHLAVGIATGAYAVWDAFNRMGLPLEKFWFYVTLQSLLRYTMTFSKNTPENSFA